MKPFFNSWIDLDTVKKSLEIGVFWMVHFEVEEVEGWVEKKEKN